MFDLLRAAAAILVFLYHYQSFAGPATSGSAFLDNAEWLLRRLGSLGTNLLLLLSGYFVVHSLRRRVSYAQFLTGRLARIYVPYVLVLLLVVAWSLLAPQESRMDLVHGSWTQLARQLLLWPGLFPEHPLLTVTWSLSYIVAGYVILPLVALGLQQVTAQRTQRILVWSAVVAACFFSAATGLISTRATYIPMGCLLYESQFAASDRKDAPVFRRLLSVGIVALTLRVLLDGHVLRIPVLGLSRAAYMGSGLLTVSSVLAAGLLLQRQHPLVNSTAWLASLASFGRTGYSFYLLHGPVTKVFAHAVFPGLAIYGAPPEAYWVVMPIAFTIAAAAAFVVYRQVEVPVHGWFNGSGPVDRPAWRVHQPQRAGGIRPTDPVANLLR